MPFLAFAIPYTHSLAHSPTHSPTHPVGTSHDVGGGAAPNEVAIDMQQIRNQPHPAPPTANKPSLSEAHFRRTAFKCQPVTVNDYFDNALAELVTPQTECGARRYSSNADLRAALGEILTFHPAAGAFSVEARIKALNLRSLLRDDPGYLPGTLTALCHDVGAHSIALGRFEFQHVDQPGEVEFLFAGESELAFLHEGNPYAPRIRADHAAILDFHYRAAGMRGHTKLPPAGYAHAAKDETHLADFTAQLGRCRQRADLARPPRATAAQRPIYNPLDQMQNGPCTIL